MEKYTLEIFALGFVACAATLPWAIHVLRQTRRAMRRRKRGWME